jgi:2,3-bisphosphoglycerate-independent phosphoglycerate mutase
METNKKKVALIILDGWGLGENTKANAIANSKTPCMDSLYEKYPHSKLYTSGENVGLPHGQMGNSEVGHLNIGAGRIVYQDLVRINKAIESGDFQKNPVLLKAIEYAKKNNKNIHLMGLVSNGGVHSHIDHLQALCNVISDNKCSNVFIHAFTDGRDCDPHSGVNFIELLQKNMQGKAKIASVIGRYYAMDRDKRWERIKMAYDMLVHRKGLLSDDALKAMKLSYSDGVTDEFIKPIVITDNMGAPLPGITEGDVVICFNFRTDRCREITIVLTQQEFPEQDMHTFPLHYITMATYDENFKGIEVLYSKDDLKNTLGEVLSNCGKTQIRIAETEKYPHVTFFFSGGREAPFPGEKRIMIPSQKVATYDLKPEMSAIEVTDAIVKELKTNPVDFICLNYANADMVGHTGVYTAIIKAVETVDACLKRVIEAGLPLGYSFIITADHGNADMAINPDGSPNTAHTTNPVPCILIDKDYHKVNEGILCDLAPSILKIMGLEVPKEMTGKVLV